MLRNQFDAVAFEQAQAITDSWNFDLAIEKILEVKADEWSRDRVNLAVHNYKRYMSLTKALNGLQLVPNGDIDEIWHMHILDTRAYMKDCEVLFGCYLHHYPYFGMLDAENKQQWLDVQNESNSFWLEIFNEPLYNTDKLAQKCPQVCPCHMDETLITASGLSQMKQSA